MKKLVTVTEEAEGYLALHGHTLSDVSWEHDIMTEPSDIQYWFERKTAQEGMPEDQELINQIGEDRVIRTAVLLDPDNEYTIEGRHRLAAALKYKLAVPVAMLVWPNKDEE